MNDAHSSFQLLKMRDFSYKEFSGILKHNGWVESACKGKGSHRKWNKDQRSIILMYNTIPAPVAKRLLKETGILQK
jgi:predicted RNA binding protein YcfA (HicA-like mRNA interferase family)